MDIQGFSKINYVFSSRRERGRPSPARERKIWGLDMGTSSDAKAANQNI